MVNYSNRFKIDLSTNRHLYCKILIRDSRVNCRKWESGVASNKSKNYAKKLL
jgi:hypothetical protein